MRLLIILFKLTIITTVLSYKRFKSFQRPLQLQSIFKDIVSQNSLRGFLILNLITEKRSLIARQSQDVMGQAARVATVACIRHPLKNHKKYARNVSRFGVAEKDKFYVRYNLAIGGDTFALIIIDNKWLTKTSMLHEKILSIFSDYHTRQGVSKTLLIAIVDKKFTKYKQLLTSRKLMYNIHILEARRSWKGKRESFKYTLIAWNPFRNTCSRRAVVKRGDRFFPILENNLNGRRLVVKTIFDKLVTLRHTSVSSHKDWSRVMINLPDKYPLETAVAMLNGSCNFALERMANRLRHWDFEFTTTNFFFVKNITLNSTFLFPPYGPPSYFLAPSFYDAHTDSSLDSLLSCFLIIHLIIFTFWAISRLHKFDLLTWEPIVLFSMIISAANPRNPICLGETILFLCLISVGFFVGSDLIFGMTSTVINKLEERPVVTLEDIVSNNITMYECYMQMHNDRWDLRRLFPKLKLVNLLNRSITFQDDYKVMILFKNLSLSTAALVICGIPIPQRIAIQGIVRARRTNIKECQWGATILAQCNRPWLDQLNYNLLRFHENSLMSYPQLDYAKHIIYRYFVGDNMNDLEMKFQSEANKESAVELKNYWMVLAAGLILPIFLLVVERIVTSRFYAYSHVTFLL